MTNGINWFEIPVTDFDRAKKFYSAIFDGDVEDWPGATPDRVAILPSGGGALVSGPSYVPTEGGPLLYLDGGDDLDAVLSRVEAAGGKVLREKSLITEQIGYMALFTDTEGNRLALHSDR